MEMKKLTIYAKIITALCAGLVFTACENGTGAEVEAGNGDDINWDNEANGTLTIVNSTAKDMVIFCGQTPIANNNLGGVRAGGTKDFDISDDVADFSAGGYTTLRGMTLDEYKVHKSNLSAAKTKYSAMATYGQGKKFRAEINPAYMGDYWFKITNTGRIGIELRKNSPDGEKIGYLPAMASDCAFYSNTSDVLFVFPVYVFYNNTTKEITAVQSASLDKTISVAPRPLTDQNIPTIRLPSDPDQIAANMVYPVAFISVTNNVANQASSLEADLVKYAAQNGHEYVGFMETLTFELTANDAGQVMDLNCAIYGGTVTIPVKDGRNQTPTVRNGYDYTVTLNYTGSGSATDPASYTAIIIEGAKRDITNEILSL
jgi:hypothetical protein